MRGVFLISALAIFLAALVAAPGGALAKSCIECHQNPAYKKEDVQELKACLRCHGSAGHPYKEEAKRPAVSFPSEAEAADTPPHPVIEYEVAPPLTDKEFETMVRIPAGEFIMGTDERLRDERPTYVTYTDAFYIDLFEVTNAEYSRFVDDTGRSAPDHWKGGKIPKGKQTHPVVYVNWNDAGAYCKWTGKRLPREAEWEKAARGIDGRFYPWGNDWDVERSNNPLSGYEDTLPIGSFEEGKSPYGLYDMSGNVWEWVDDFYQPHPGSDYISPEFGAKHRLLKGGSWWDCMFYGCGISAPTYNRAFFDAITKNDSMGFRCAAGVAADGTGNGDGGNGDRK